MKVLVKTQSPPLSRKSCTPKRIRQERKRQWSVHTNRTRPSTLRSPNRISGNVGGRVLLAANASLRPVFFAPVGNFLYLMGCECYERTWKYMTKVTEACTQRNRSTRVIWPHFLAASVRSLV